MTPRTIASFFQPPKRLRAEDVGAGLDETGNGPRMKVTIPAAELPFENSKTWRPGNELKDSPDLSERSFLSRKLVLEEGMPLSHVEIARSIREPYEISGALPASWTRRDSSWETTISSNSGRLEAVEYRSSDLAVGLTNEGKKIAGIERVAEMQEQQDNPSPVNKEQRMRMDMNKTMARAKRNLRTCEERVSRSQGLGLPIPNLEDLLVEQSWQEALPGELRKPYTEKLNAFVRQEAMGKVSIYPPPALIFNAFNTCPFDKVKVVIIGQDPYHGPRQAMGLSFSVPEGLKIPSSLVNIYKEIKDDVGCSIPGHGNLEKWAHQGVLLLNTVLTVREHHANSHAKKGWEVFTDSAIRAVSQQRRGIVFLLWGNSAQEKTRLIDSKVHHILKAAHPSGLSAHRGFFMCRHFSQTNKILENAGQLPIDWQL